MFAESDVLLWTETDHQRAVAEAESLFWSEPRTAECDRLKILVSLIEAYEDVPIPMKEPSAGAVAEYVRDKQCELAYASTAN